MKINHYQARMATIGTTMTAATRTPTKATFAISAIVALGLITSACASHHAHPHKTDVPTWGGSAPVATTNAPVYNTAPEQTATVASYSANGRFTFTQGCTGAFSVRDARTNREISSGRAFNSGSGLIALDSQGRQTRAVSSSISQSVTFLPDCNCRAGGNQTSSVSPTQRFAATAPSAATCAAG
jgi:hypothetical protein